MNSSHLVTIFCRILVSLNVISFLWSVIGIFKSNKEKESLKYRGLQIFSVLTWITCLYAVYFSDLTDIQSWALCLCQLICLISFWSHAQLVKRHQFTIVYSLDQPQKLIKSGFYAYIRNPFYLTYLVCYFSVGIFSFNGAVLSLSLVMLWFYIDAARLEEEKFMNSSLSLEYKEYYRSTGRFLPKIGTDHPPAKAS